MATFHDETQDIGDRIEQMMFLTACTDDRTVLRPVDHSAIFCALENPPLANGRLRAAFERHGETVESGKQLKSIAAGSRPTNTSHQEAS